MVGFFQVNRDDSFLNSCAALRVIKKVSRTKLEVCCTVKAARLALEHGVALSCAGGTHHAHRHWGSGFTVRARFLKKSDQC